MSHKPFSGVITAMVTPFKDNFEIDYANFHKLLELQKNAKINGVVILGTTGESPTLTEEESQNLVAAALEHQSDDFHIYVGTGTNDTRTSIEKSKKYANFKSSSAKGSSSSKTPNGVMVVTPYYNKPMQSHLAHHYRAVCNAVPDTPVCVYNVPGRTGVNLNPDTFALIAKENQNVVAIKEAAGNTNAVAELRLQLDKIGKKDLVILSGDDATFAPALLCGAQGVISVTTNLIPSTMVQMLQASQENQFVQLKKFQLDTFCLQMGVFCVPNPVGIKWLMAQVGLCGPTLRPPLYAPTGIDIDNLNKILYQLGENNVPTSASVSR